MMKHVKFTFVKVQLDQRAKLSSMAGSLGTRSTESIHILNQSSEKLNVHV